MKHSEVLLSVVIPCLNSEATIHAQLEALNAQTTDVCFEIIICDNGSTDSTLQVAAKSSLTVPLKVFDASGKPGPAYARNVGIRESNSPLILFCDSDDRVHDGWVDAYWRAFENGAQIMGGTQNRVRSLKSAPSETFGLMLTFGFMPWVSSSNLAVARTVFDEIGSFDERYDQGGEDTDLSWRAQLAGLQLTRVPTAQIDYLQRATTRGMAQQVFRWGRSHVQLFAMYHREGMTAPNIFRSAQKSALLTAKLVFVSNPNVRTTALRGLAIQAGRLRESIRTRTWYF